MQPLHKLLHRTTIWRQVGVHASDARAEQFEMCRHLPPGWAIVQAAATAVRTATLAFGLGQHALNLVSGELQVQTAPCSTKQLSTVVLGFMCRPPVSQS